MPTHAPKRRIPAPARRALILDAALEEFAAHGYEGASMGRIATAAGVTRPVLYDHFDSKRELFAAVLEAKHAELLSHMRDAIVADAPLEQRMRATIDAYLAFAEREPMAWGLLFPAHEPVDRDAAADFRRRRTASNRLLAEMLAPDARRAGLDPASAVGQAMFALQTAALHGLVLWWRSHPKAKREDLVQAAMDLMWTGIDGLGRS